MTSIPQEYKHKLDYLQTQEAIKLLKDTFERRLARKLKLTRVSAPKFLAVGDGLQDDLAGTQTPVSFTAKGIGAGIEIVHSLAKWKRHTLGKHHFAPGSGLYTDMDAIRKDEAPGPIHSIYVDQWDWEQAIMPEQRSIAYLKRTVKQIYQALKETHSVLTKRYHVLTAQLPSEVYFIHSEELEKLYPDSDAKERERLITQKHGAVFLIGIGYPLASGQPQDLRAADYDDWVTPTHKGFHGLNGDLLVWDTVRKDALELSSMGVRVVKDSLLAQLDMMGQTHKQELSYHQDIITGKLPCSIGGGIGQSRLCMYLLEKAHIGEVQSSVWSKEVQEEFKKRQIPLL